MALSLRVHPTDNAPTPDARLTLPGTGTPRALSGSRLILSRVGPHRSTIRVQILQAHWGWARLGPSGCPPSPARTMCKLRLSVD